MPATIGVREANQTQLHEIAGGEAVYLPGMTLMPWHIRNQVVQEICAEEGRTPTSDLSSQNCLPAVFS